MNVYEIIAKNNPKVAEQIIDSFGYEIKDNRNLGKSLKELVANEGEPAFRKIMYYHPDREVILELFSGDGIKVEPEKKSCNCSGCASKAQAMFSPQMGFMNAGGHYYNADGAKDNHNTTLANQTNVILLVASLFVATALIIKK